MPSSYTSFDEEFNAECNEQTMLKYLYSIKSYNKKEKETRFDRKRKTERKYGGEWSDSAFAHIFLHLVFSPSSFSKGGE